MLLVAGSQWAATLWNGGDELTEHPGYVVAGIPEGPETGLGEEA